MLTPNEAMSTWFQFSDFDFMDCDLDEHGCYTFYGVAQDGTTKIEKIHVDTLKIFRKQKEEIVR